MKTLLTALTLLFTLSSIPRAADPDIVGTWFGTIDTDRGQMEIGLTVSLQKEKLVGALKTAHGDWDVTG